MPVTSEQVNITYKILPLTIFADNSVSVTVRKGLLHADGTWEQICEQQLNMAAAEVVSILDVQPTPGLTRRDDIAYAIYTHLVSTGAIGGTIS